MCPYDILVYKALKFAPRVNNEIVISYAKLAKITGLQQTMVSSCIRSLRQKGFISVMKKYNNTGGVATNHYKLLRPLEVLK